MRYRIFIVIIGAASAAMGSTASATSPSLEVPPGVIAPPFERPIDRPPMQAAVIVRGVVKSVHIPGSLEPTTAYLEHMKVRFTDWPDQENRGLWHFQLARIRVSEVLRAEARYSHLEPGSVVDLYVSRGISVGTVGDEVIVFMEAYTHSEAGPVSPYSSENSAFVIGQRDKPDFIIRESRATSACPGKAQAESELLILRLSAIDADLAELLSKGGGHIRDDGYVESDSFASTGIGHAATLNPYVMERSPFSCDDIVDYDDVSKLIIDAFGNTGSSL